MRNLNENVEIGIIGGTGVYDPNLIKDAKEIKIYTPFGATSDLIVIGQYLGRKVAFLPRHGRNHHIPPHNVPYRANIWAMKQLGIKRILATCAVGSLRKDYKPGELVITDQFIDFTKNREYTFFEGGQVCHIPVADPFCSELRVLANQTAKTLKINFHDKGTNICVQGPRYSTRAESIFFKDVVKADIIGMTLIPECVLARAAEICYLSIAAVTDYDTWADEPVNATIVDRVMKSNVKTIRQLLTELIPQIPVERKICECYCVLDTAMQAPVKKTAPEEKETQYVD